MPKSKAINILAPIEACLFGGFIIYTLACTVLPILAKPTTFELLMALFSALAIFYYLSLNSKLGDARALLCAGNALVLLVLVFGLYFSQTISYINHSAILCYAAAIFMMLTVIAEANGILCRRYLRRYISYAPVAVVLAFALSVPDLIYAVINLSAPLNNIYYDFIFLGLAAYHLVRLITLAKVTPAEEEK